MDLQHWAELDWSGFSFPPEKRLPANSRAGLWVLVASISINFLVLSAGAVLVFQLVVAAQG